MDETSLPPGWWGQHPAPPRRHSIADLIANDTLDAELAGLLWLLVEGRVPVIVAGESRAVGKTTLLTALLDFLPPGMRTVPLRGIAEDYAWLPEARELGWTDPGVPAGRAPRPASPRPDPRSTYLLAPELSDHSPAYLWGDGARVAIRALSLGYGLGTTIHADSLEAVFTTLRRSPVRLTDDELSHLGVVLVLRATRDPEPQRRVAAAHYVRPLARDQHGHVQRLGPAVLATWDERRDAFEHFAWGVTPELALRTGRRAGDFEIEHERRRDYLAGLASSGGADPGAVRTAILNYQHAAPTPPSLAAHPN